MRPTNTILFFLLVSLFFANINCKNDEPLQPKTDNPPTVDTTSHNFTWTTYTFAGNYGSSYFKDVAIINDSDIWAVGLVYAAPETSYGAAHWDGKIWRYKRLQYTSSGNTSPLTNIRGIQYISSSEIWLAAGSIFRWDGVSSQTEFSFSRLTLVDPNGSIEKIWGISGNLFGVGNAGTIVHHDGSKWTKQESGTTIDLRDVWGSVDGKTVWACGWSYDNSKSILLKYDGSIWKTIWLRNDLTSLPPFEYFVTSVWGDKSLYLSTGRGVFRISEKETTKTVILPWFPYRIRGSGENNIATAGDAGMIWHYNGANWKEVSSQTDHTQYSIAVSKNMIVAVGSDNSIGFGAGLIRMGKRNE